MLDPQKSEEARKRFLRRVQEGMGDDGEGDVPPVPRIPNGLVGVGGTRGANGSGWF